LCEVSGQKHCMRVTGMLGAGVQSATLIFYKLLKMNYITKKIVRKDDAVHRQFLGVDFEVLAIGQESMVTKMHYKTTDNVPYHKHPNEQNGYVISGKYKLQFENNEYIITAGDSYSIPSNVEHTLEIIDPGEVIDVFTPVRQDYL